MNSIHKYHTRNIAINLRFSKHYLKCIKISSSLLTPKKRDMRGHLAKLLTQTNAQIRFIRRWLRDVIPISSRKRNSLISCNAPVSLRCQKVEAQDALFSRLR